MGQQSASRRVGLVVALTALAVVPLASAYAAAPGWSQPLMIMQTNGRVGGMVLASDGFGKLHLFYRHQVSESSPASVDYAYWDESGWSDPVDLIVETGQEGLSSVRAVVDVRQEIHLMWRQGGVLRHASAPASEARKVGAWSAPSSIVRALGDSDIAVGADGTLYVAYAEPTDIGLVSLVRSQDGGVVWSAPGPVAQVSQANAAPDGIRLTMDGAGRLHCTWTEYQLPDGWPPLGAYYTRSTDGGQNWAPPLQVTGPAHGQIGIGVVGENELHLVWRSTVGGDGTFHQWSGNGGETWAPQDRHADRGGFSGLPSFAADTTGRMHYVIGYGGYAFWSQGFLSEYQYPMAEVRQAANVSESLEQAVLAITSGNRIHMVMEADFKSLWHVSRLLDVPPLPTVTPAPAPRAAEGGPTQVPTPAEPLAAATQAVRPSVPVALEQPRSDALSGAYALLLGVVPAALAVLAAVLVHLRSRQR